MKDYSNYYPSINDRVISDTEILFREKLNTLDGHDILIDGVAQKVIIHNHTNPLDEYKEDRKLLCLNEVNIHRGSVVFLEGENYLTVTDIDQNITFKECKIRKTNYTLKYQDKFGNIIEVPCIATNATLYSLGVQETKVVTLPDGKLSIVLPSNSNTQQIDRGLRILHYKHPYKVTFVDYSQNGLIGLVLSEDEIQDQDDLVNGVAWNGYVAPTPQSDIYEITILNNQALTLNRWSSWQIEWEVKKNGEIVNLPVTFTTSNSNIVSVNSSGLCQTTSSTGSATITVKISSNPAIYKTISITNVTSNATYTCEIDGESILDIGDQSKYVGLIKSSGIIQTDKSVVWEINFNGNPTNIIKYETGINECMIWANNVGITGTIYLIAKYINNPSIQFTKTIDIKRNILW
jgi:hypothetical protein